MADSGAVCDKLSTIVLFLYSPVYCENWFNF